MAFGGFGTTPAANPLFGQPKTQQTTPNIFGATNSLFGANTNTNNANPQQPSQAAPATNSLFGGGSNIFGQSQQQPQQAQQPAQTNNLFGAPNGTPNLSTNIFGNNTTPAQGQSNLFGNTGSTNPGGLLKAPSAQGNSMFGLSQPAAGASLFGNTTQSATTNTQQNQQNAQPGGLFSGFNNPAGTQNQQPTKPNIFGASAAPTTNLFGASTTNNALGTSTFGGLAPASQPALSASLLVSKGPAQSQADASAQSTKMMEKIQTIYNAWDPQSPQCRFQRVFYNLVDPNQVNLYGRPPNATSEELWQKAVRENPDPSCLVPVIATSFDDLRMRVEAQSQQSASHEERVKDIQTRITELKSRHSTSTVSKLARLATAQTQSTLRLLAFIQHLHLLIPTIRSSSIRPEEEELRQKLEAVEQELLGGGGRVRGKMGELWAVVGAVRARQTSTGSQTEWKVVDEEGLAKIAQILSEQQAGLIHLTKILKKDTKDLAIVMGTSEDTAPEETFGVEALFSTSSLRASNVFR